MKVNKLFFCTIASLLTVQTMSPDFIQNIQQLHGRKPATEPATEINYYAVEEYGKNRSPSTEVEVETEAEKSVSNEKNVAKLKLKNGKAPLVEGININNDDSGLSFRSQDKKPSSVSTGLCEAELVGQNLVTATKKSFEDTKKVAEVELKAIPKVESKIKEKKVEEKEIIIEEKKPEEKKHKVKISDASEDSSSIALMLQITSMYTAQMESQMQSQMMLFQMMLFQMTSMSSQAPRNAIPQVNPYGPSLQYPTLTERIGFLESRVGIAAPSSPWSNSQNPYQIMPLPTLERQSLPDYGGFRIPAASSGFNFHQVSPEPTARINMPESLVMEPPMSFIGK